MTQDMPTACVTSCYAQMPQWPGRIFVRCQYELGRPLPMALDKQNGGASLNAVLWHGSRCKCSLQIAQTRDPLGEADGKVQISKFDDPQSPAVVARMTEPSRGHHREIHRSARPMDRPTFPCQADFTVLQPQAPRPLARLAGRILLRRTLFSTASSRGEGGPQCQRRSSMVIDNALAAPALRGRTWSTAGRKPGNIQRCACAISQMLFPSVMPCSRGIECHAA
jgi:hypothetical protein